jgi:hypothetical protein
VIVSRHGVSDVPTWKSGGYTFRLYQNDHPPLHIHIFRDNQQLDRFDLESGQFMDGTVGRHAGRVLQAMRDVGLIG